jgi:hypothetical protein
METLITKTSISRLLLCDPQPRPLAISLRWIDHAFGDLGRQNKNLEAVHDSNAFLVTVCDLI